MKKIIYKIIIIAIILFIPFLSKSQTGYISGKIVNKNTGETLIGVTVVVPETSKGTVSDLDGNYKIPLSPGTYSLKMSFLSFQETVIKDVVVNPNKVTKLDVQMSESDVKLQEVTVTAKSRKNTESSFLVMKKKSAQVMDGITSEEMSKLGDSDAADALKRVTGVAVQEGKYVYVRGLGDRYSKITLNNAEIPGLDPNKNTVQMDLFPSNVIENISVHKSFTPDLPGSFTGGHVDVITKDFPDKFNLQVSASTGYNPQSNLNDNFISYQGGNTDWLGMDDGTREIPQLYKDEISKLDPDGINIITFPYYNYSELRGFSQSFNNQVETENISSGLNQSYEFGIGNQIKLFGKPLGFNLALSYKRNFSYFDNGKATFYEAKVSPSALAVYELDEKGTDEVKYAGLVNFNYKLSRNNKIGFTFLKNQGGAKIARFRRGPFPYESHNHINVVRELGYIERSFNSFQVDGKNVFPGLANTEINWLSSYTISEQNEPDLRIFNNLISPSTQEPFIKTNNGPTRNFRFLDEANFDNKLNIIIPANIAGNKAKIKFGGAYVYKYRTSDQTGFEVNPNNCSRIGDSFNAYLSDSLVNPNTGTGYYYTMDYNNDLKNSYTGESYVAAAYSMIDIPIGDKLRIIAGLRYEHSEIDVSKRYYEESNEVEDTTGTELLENDFLPALNLTYELITNMNLRLSATRTLARPVFQEVSSSQFYDYQESVRKYGNPNLKRSLISNFDLRWEYFFQRGEMFGFSLFYKDFKYPIAQRYVPEAVNPEIEFINSDQAQAYGFEVELRKNLSFISPLKDFSFGVNYSMIKSSVKKPADEVEAVRVVKPDYEDTRVMFGQAPYLLNSYLKYTNAKIKFDANVGFNINGEKLMVITKGYAPYIYEQPRADLNFNISKGFGDNFSIKFSVDNILDSPYKAVHHFEESDKIYYKYSLGRTYSLSVKFFIN